MLNTIHATLTRLNEIASSEDTIPLLEKVTLYHEEQLLVSYLENAGRSVTYNYSEKSFSLKLQDHCSTCGSQEPVICLLDTGLPVCNQCLDFLASIQRGE